MRYPIIAAGTGHQGKAKCIQESIGEMKFTNAKPAGTLRCSWGTLSHCSREHKFQGIKASTIQNIERKLDPRVLARHVEEGKPLAKSGHGTNAT